MGLFGIRIRKGIRERIVAGILVVGSPIRVLGMRLSLFLLPLFAVGSPSSGLLSSMVFACWNLEILLMKAYSAVRRLLFEAS